MMGIRHIPDTYILLSVELTEDEYELLNDRDWVKKDYELYYEIASNKQTDVNIIKRAYFFYLNLYYEEIDNWVDYSITLTELTTKSLQINSYLNYVFNDNVVRDVKLKVVTKHDD